MTSETKASDNDKIGEMLPAAAALSLAGNEYSVKPLNFNQLVLIEEKYGSLTAMDIDSFAGQRWLVWLVLNRENPHLTVEDVGEMLTVQNPGETFAFIAAVLRVSGLMQPEGEETPEAEASPKKRAANGKAAPLEKPTPSAA